MSSKDSLLKDNALFTTIGLPAQDAPSACLFVVGLPIGNLADITLRALWILSSVDFIGAEDTRETRKLLDKFNIAAQLFPVHQHNEHEGAEKIITLLSEGKSVALVTDAGTPAVSDPGSKVVADVRSAGFRVIPVPGASAAVTAMSAAGMAPEGFIFHGFLEGGKEERRAVLAETLATGRTCIFYEAPHRILKFAEELSSVVPESRKIVIARELTKKFESIESFTPKELAQWTRTHQPKGEYAVIVDAAPRKIEEEALSPRLRAWVDALYDKLPTGELASMAAAIEGASKKNIYNYILALKKEKNSEAD